MEIRDLFDFFSSRRRHTRYWRDWSSDVCSSDLTLVPADDGGWVQADRGARTQQATFLCPNEEKEAYVSGEIGRASCRARVKISVGAVSLKNKLNIRPLSLVPTQSHPHP